MSKKIRIILVEDNDDERFFMKEGFAATGLYEVVAEASNGHEMLAFFQKPGFKVPELVVTDLNMPGKNGYDIIRDVKADTELAKIPVLILSTAPVVPYAEKCKKMGACAFYTKPDTFLEYKGFAEQIYQEVITGCLQKD